MLRSFLLCCCIFSGAQLRADELLAGAARCDITPPLGYAMWGYGARHDAPSVGVLDPLQARALVLAVGNQRIALISLDLGRAPTRHSTAAIRAKVKEAGVGTDDMPILDIGCGRGEWLELLRSERLNAYGIDINRVLLEQCRHMGLRVVDADLLAHVRSLPDASILSGMR